MNIEFDAYKVKGNPGSVEKYKNIQKQMWRDISTENMEKNRDGGVTSAVS